MTINKLTHENLERAFAGESMAYTKYMWFAMIARGAGHDDVADHFEWTASQELKHAWGHLELLHNLEIPTVEECLQLAIAGETYEYTDMYPKMEEEARWENNSEAIQEFEEQIKESTQHAEEFQRVLDSMLLAERRFGALKRVEERHANNYRKLLENM